MFISRSLHQDSTILGSRFAVIENGELRLRKPTEVRSRQNGGNSFLDEIDDTLSAIENRLLNDIDEKRNLAEIILRR